MTQTTEQIIEQNLYIWGVRVLYLLAGRALVNFPGGNRAHPSREVYVDLARGAVLPGRTGDQAYFPFRVHWRVWQEQIIPILGDSANQLTVAVNQTRLAPLQIEDLVKQYAGLVEQIFREGGLIPPSAT